VSYFGDSELETVNVSGCTRNILASRTLRNRRRKDTKLKFCEITFNPVLLFTDAEDLLHQYMKEMPKTEEMIFH